MPAEVRTGMALDTSTDGNQLIPRFLTAIPSTAEACAREMEYLEKYQQIILDRLWLVSAQLRNVVRGEATSSEMKKSTPEEQEAVQIKTNKAERESQTSDFVSGSATASDLNLPEYDGDTPLEASNPLVSAIKRLRHRRDQKRGIKIWTKNLKNLFWLTDQDGSGCIEVKEWHQMLDMLDISNELKCSLREEFGHADIDSSKTINIKEFLLFFLNMPVLREEIASHAKNNAPYVYDSNLSCTQRCRQWLYLVVECPGHNFVSKVLFCIDLILTFVPIVIVCAEGSKSGLVISWSEKNFMWSASIFFASEYLCGLLMCRHKKKFIFDIVHTFELVSFIFWIYYNTLGSAGTLDPMAFVVFRVIRYVNLYKVFKLVALEEDLALYVNTLKLAYTSSGAVIGLLLLTIFLFSVLMHVFERGMWNTDETRWERNVDDGGESPFASLYSCIYFVIVTMTTLGYGDLLPKSQVGRIISMMTVLVGLCTITFLINIIGDCFEEVFREFVLKKSREIEKEQAVFLKECVHGAQGRSKSIMSLSLSLCGSHKRPRETTFHAEATDEGEPC